MAMLVAASCVASSHAATVVGVGYDLLRTAPGTQFMGQPFTGVPIGIFDFGGSIGVQNLGLTDTLIYRSAPVETPLPDTVPIEIVALQLMSVNPIDLGAGLGTHYITLQSARGGPASAGTVTVDNTTFDNAFSVFYDVRFGALNGPIILSDVLDFTGSGLWSHDAEPGTFLIDGVNHLLNGVDISTDFHLAGPVTHIDNSGPGHAHIVISTPEPQHYALGAVLGLLAFAGYRRLRLG
ncbi:MAG: hypothetical protein H7A45_09090 [Verrucomicrobiales bacterium]|nr:hypothetical protein [Verrucomicrobiales bacterium]